MIIELSDTKRVFIYSIHVPTLLLALVVPTYCLFQLYFLVYSLPQFTVSFVLVFKMSNCSTTRQD